MSKCKVSLACAVQRMTNEGQMPLRCLRTVPQLTCMGLQMDEFKGKVASHS